MPSRIEHKSGEVLGSHDIMFVKEAERKTQRRAVFECFCGNTFVAAISDVRSNHTKSCGCRKNKVLLDRNTTHGESKTRLHYIWVSMRQRCNDKNCKSYDSYGARGISVSQAWDNFTDFRYWALSNGYQSNLSLDRIDVNKGYSPENCRWVNDFIQMQNRRKGKNNTSGYKGVSYEKLQNKFSSKIRANGKNYFLGWYDDALKAALAYNSFVIKNNLAHTLNEIGDEKCA